MRRLYKFTVLCVLACSSSPALAHPHVFIDAGVEVVFDTSGRAEALRITWVYDELYSMLLVGERNLDQDFDGLLTPAEQRQLSGFDMNWDAGYPGDTYALVGDVDLPLSRAKDFSARYEDGKITTVHLRTFDAPVPIGDVPLIIQVYDPGFYTAYTVMPNPLVTGGSGCVAVAYGPDIDAADEALKAALAEYSADADLEADFPAIGKNYAEEVRVTCAAP